MIRVSVLYPNSQGSRFDFSYYTETHIPMAIEYLSAHPGFKGISVERGVSTAVPSAPPAYTAICHFLFSSIADFLAAFTPHAAALRGDMPNYTNTEPTIQFNEVLISK